MVGVGGHALEAEQQRGAKGDKIRFPLPEPGCVLLRVKNAVRAQCVVDPVGEGADGGIIKIYVGQGRKQSVRQKLRDGGGLLVFAETGFRKQDQPADQLLLQMGGLGLLAAYAGADTAAAAGGLLALKAKHFGHDFPSF